MIYSLTITTISHQDFIKINLFAIFPNVQILTLKQKFMRCIDCSFQLPEDIELEPIEVKTAYNKKIHQCLRLTRITCLNFEKLTHLRANIGLPQIDMFHKYYVWFTRETLSMETFLNCSNAGDFELFCEKLDKFEMKCLTTFKF